MGASFRSKEQVLALAGCDFLTISPDLLKELQASTEKVEKALDVEQAKKSDLEKVEYDEKKFRWALGQDPCATAKLADGIVRFAQDAEKLEEQLRMELSKKKAKK